MNLRNIVGAIGLSLCLSGCPDKSIKPEAAEDATDVIRVYYAERITEEVMTYHADYCIARECSRERNRMLCDFLRPYDALFKRYENHEVYGERARKIREAIANTLSRCD